MMLGFQPEVCVCPSAYDIVIKLCSWGGKQFLFNWYVGWWVYVEIIKKEKEKLCYNFPMAVFFET